MWPGDALPQRGDTNWKIFYASGTDWQTYMKPPGASMIYIFMLAAGAGGSRVANGSVTNGGGGGGSGGTSRILLPAALLPDIIYVRPGLGGLGATTANTVGGAGATSYVGVSPTVLQQSNILQQGGAAAPANTQAAGAAGTVANIVNSAYSSFGVYFSTAGQAGGAGASAANGNGSSVTPLLSGTITSGGGGGGNGTGTGGSISSSAEGFVPVLTTDTSVANGARDGFQRGAIIAPGLKTFPMFFTGGTGGIGVTTAITAGNGGNASYGGGGGGGGGGTNAGSISGNGGNGGDALIIIGAL